MIRRDAVHDDRPALGVAGPQRQDLLVGRLAAAAPLGDLLGLAPSLLRALGGFLVLFAATVWLVAARAAPAPAAVTAIIAANVL